MNWPRAQRRHVPGSCSTGGHLGNAPTEKIANPRLNTVQSLAKALGCETGELATPDPDEVQPPKPKRQLKGQ
jgi:hypothetical protein